MGKKGSFIKSLAIALAVHALLFLFFARLIMRGQVVSEAPSMTLVEAKIIGSGGAGGGSSPAGLGRPLSDRNEAPKTMRAAAPATPTPLPQAPVPHAQVAQAPVAAAGPTASSSASSGGPPNQGASGRSPGSGPTGANGARGGSLGPPGSGGGTARALPAETGADASFTIADIDPVPMWTIAAAYPSSARLLGQEGLVKVEADINAGGVVIACRVAASSGFGSLDNAALDSVQRARFLPAMKNGRQVASKIVIPISFQLTQD